MEEDWDYLIILDACRYDTFKKINRIEGELHKKKSLGSATPEWLIENFKGKKLDDVIYVSGNPFSSSEKFVGFKPENNFLQVIGVWDKGWHKNLGTVSAEEVTKAALETLKQYLDKRIIIHYMQPHSPFLGKTDVELDRNYPGLIFGDISIERVMKAYEDNLKYVLKEVKKVLKHLDGNIVITSDHGTLFGERGLYFHIPNIRMDEINDVPWLEIRK
ncbi:MAG: sulfatase-like hydrolase/transferase [Candidatus Aenigmatarchaeota archaeon]